jgi:hypothetical protein
MIRRVLMLAVLLSGGCFAPSLPVPPPQPELMAFSYDPTSSTATFRANADADWALAKVYVFDEASGRGVITTANGDGSVDETPRFAVVGLNDRIEIIYELADQSVGLCLFLADGPSSGSQDCRGR